MRKLLTWQQVGNDNSLPTVPHYEQQAVFYVQNVQYSLPFSGRVVHLTPYLRTNSGWSYWRGYTPSSERHISLCKLLLINFI